MQKNKKILIITLTSIVIAIILVIGIIFIINQTNKNKSFKEEEKVQVSKEELEKNFINLFSNAEYTDNINELVSLAYDMEREETNKYKVKVNIPKINIESDEISEINKEIIDTYGRKLIDIVNNNKEYSIYNIDYITYTNEDILSVVIKCTLKDGTNPQRVIIQTYNYDLQNEKTVTLKDILNKREINQTDLQSRIIETVREKNVNSKALAEQGYNIYVRDIRSDEYLIDNIKTFFIGQDGYIYIIFAYGNSNFTETMDVIVI